MSGPWTRPADGHDGMQVGVSPDGVVVAIWIEGKLTECAMPADAAFDQALSLLGAACDVDPKLLTMLDMLPVLVRERRHQAKAVRR